MRSRQAQDGEHEAGGPEGNIRLDGAVPRHGSDPEDKAAALGLNEPLFDAVPEQAVVEKSEALYKQAVDKIKRKVESKDEELHRKAEKENNGEKTRLEKDSTNLLEKLIDSRVTEGLQQADLNGILGATRDEFMACKTYVASQQQFGP